MIDLNKTFYLVLFFFISCNYSQKNKTGRGDLAESISEGKQLAKHYCQTCHELPDPSMLSKDKWKEGVLPEMGPRLGILAYGFNKYPSAINNSNAGASYYPSHPIISFDDWQHIIDYYTLLSPDALIASKNDSVIHLTNSLFLPVFKPFASNASQPVTGCVYIDTSSTQKNILVADEKTGTIVSNNEKGELIDLIQYRSPVVNMILRNDTLTTANIGILNPNDAKTGTIQQVRYHNGKFLSQPKKLAIGLRRPVHIDIVDLNGDGRKDILVCEFGNLKGALSWLENKGNDTYERHVIREQPGAIATVIKDFNKDGLPDFYVLFAQGDEQIIRFENKGNNNFEMKQLLRFPPMYGSSYFEMKDMNNDGFDDIIYTCGDNGDYSVELKPYHGLYIFTNDGQDNFTKHYFFHINGCFKAKACDFDGDGKNDIAAISFFADYKHRPEEGFVYLKNMDKNKFKPYTLPVTKNGRWLCMDVGDVNNDGKPDIVLGNFSYPSFISSSVDWAKQPAFLLLKNNMP